MMDWIRLALHPQFHLAWNLFLALVPLVLALVLFRVTVRRGWWWWLLLAVFVAFLPNASYTVTDIIHFVEEVRDQPELPVWSVIYIIIPKYAIFIFVCFQAHVLSLLLLGRYLQHLGFRGWVVPTEFLLNFLCAIAVYWGRYLRLNSWDIASRPYSLAQTAIASLSTEFGVAVVLRYFVVITMLYYLVKLVDLALWYYCAQTLAAWRGGGGQSTAAPEASHT